MKTPFVTVMRTQGARRRHEAAKRIKSDWKWLDDIGKQMKRSEAKIEEIRRKHQEEMDKISRSWRRGLDWGGL